MYNPCLHTQLPASEYRLIDRKRRLGRLQVPHLHHPDAHLALNALGHHKTRSLSILHDTKLHSEEPSRFLSAWQQIHACPRCPHSAAPRHGECRLQWGFVRCICLFTWSVVLFRVVSVDHSLNAYHFMSLLKQSRSRAAPTMEVCGSSKFSSILIGLFLLDRRGPQEGAFVK